MYVKSRDHRLPEPNIQMQMQRHPFRISVHYASLCQIRITSCSRSFFLLHTIPLVCSSRPSLSLLSADRVPNIFVPAIFSDNRTLSYLSVCMSISASQWGSPTASRRALLIHGFTMSSNSWEGVAQLLVAEGYFVIAPNLLGHGWRQGTDYSASAFAEDLRPYFAMDTSYDVVIGHSFGGLVALSLLPFLPKTKETTMILLDPALEIVVEKIAMDNKSKFMMKIMNVRTADEYMAENPAWSRRDSVLRALGLSMCDRTVVEKIYGHNMPWSFSGLFKNIPPNVKITVLASDPEFGSACDLELVPRDVERLNTRVLTGIGHWIQYECPDAIMDEIPLPRANL
ncbi:Alpha/Beta hydrolase protein [Suillus ampliporus]|nr:Alpha/Beta hydrolase protein [Suillus ampliporus]